MRGILLLSAISDSSDYFTSLSIKVKSQLTCKDRLAATPCMCQAEMVQGSVLDGRILKGCFDLVSRSQNLTDTL